jgi:hypothetical protein
VRAELVLNDSMLEYCACWSTVDPSPRPWIFDPLQQCCLSRLHSKVSLLQSSLLDYLVCDDALRFAKLLLDLGVAFVDMLCNMVYIRLNRQKDLPLLVEPFVPANQEGAYTQRIPRILLAQ